ncbi:MAG: alkaline phosphatase family protein [Acidobacteria bacterium]|nr:alkaline phosphatase family protein [Acidobacteriota bacterium]MCL5288121.1 alkaline phosphatase family protein [Acidobacteriota bacterium]
MKICILGLDCCAPDVVFRDERLTNIRRLMDAGTWGRLESVIPPITVPAWMCMTTSQDPGSLGVYGFRNRTDHSYSGLGIASSASIKTPAIWDHIAREGKKSIIVGVPPGYPPRRINGISVGCFLTPDTTKDVYTNPPEVGKEINALVGEYPVDVKGFRTDDKEWLKKEIFEMSEKQWKVVKWLLKEKEWDFFHFVDIGQDRVHHGFWDSFDKQHIFYKPGNPYENVIPDYYAWVDKQIGEVLELLDSETVLLIVSDHGAQRLDGGFVVNEWLVKEGLLVLDEYPKEVTPFGKLKVNWAKTKVWSEGGYYARVFFNVQGREPQGVIPQSEYESFQNEMKKKFEALTDDKGKPLNSLVFKPKELYKSVKNVAPDLIVHFGGLYWRSIGGVGYGRVHVQENDTGPDACNHAQYGMFLLAAPNLPLRGEYTGAKLLDVAPTLLDLAGYDIPEVMQGRSLVAGMEKKPPEGFGSGEDAVKNRLEGLGYI